MWYERMIMRLSYLCSQFKKIWRRTNWWYNCIHKQWIHTKKMILWCLRFWIKIQVWQSITNGEETSWWWHFENTVQQMKISKIILWISFNFRKNSLRFCRICLLCSQNFSAQHFLSVSCISLGWNEFSVCYDLSSQKQASKYVLFQWMI